MDNTLSLFWNANRIILKSFLIGFLMLILLIPFFFIQQLISERQERQKEAVDEISAKWAGPQTITGPVIAVPYIEPLGGVAGTPQQKKWAYFLPDQLSIHSRIIPERRYRGIYQVIVYSTELQINGSYDSLRFADLGIPADKIIWSEAAVFLPVSDTRGLKEDARLRLGSEELDLEPEKFSNDQFKNALSARLPMPLSLSLYGAPNPSLQGGSGLVAAATINHGPVQFSTTLSLKGSENLLFVPTGKNTSVQASSSWSNPSFTGSYLPDLRSVKDSGFEANWKVLHLNRNYPQQWKDRTYPLDASAFGVNLIVPVDSYQQTTRSVKYAILVILLTFTAFFLIELIYSKAIHSLQYLLVGAALCIFYTLLLSFSEYIGFNGAYGVAAVATISLIAWYVRSILRSSKMSLFIGSLLTLLYGFIFTLIQLQDYALLMGSIGLFITLAVVMYFSRKIKWSKEPMPVKAPGFY